MISTRPPTLGQAFRDSRWALFQQSPSFVRWPCERALFERIDAQRLGAADTAMTMEAYYAWFRQSEALFDPQGQLIETQPGEHAAWATQWQGHDPAAGQRALARVLRPHPLHQATFEAAVAPLLGAHRGQRLR